MIDPKELMILNRVLYRGEETTILELWGKEVVVGFNGVWTDLISYDEIQPIKLTKEVLERVGLKPSLNYPEIYWSEKDILENMFEWSTTSYDADRKCLRVGTMSDTIPCEHLHHLQNLTNVLGVKLNLK